MWTYKQANGDLLKDGVFESAGYSGHGDGLNDPEAEAIVDVGPIPRGLWKIAEWFDHYEDKGPCVARLEPVGHDAHGRSGFLIHGDSAAANHTASHGCIILGPLIRKAMRDSGDHDLTVERE